MNLRGLAFRDASRFLLAVETTRETGDQDPVYPGAARSFFSRIIYPLCLTR